MKDRWVRGILVAGLAVAGCEVAARPGPTPIVKPTATPQLQEREIKEPFLFEREVPVGTVLGNLRELKTAGREADFKSIFKVENPDGTQLMIVQWEGWQFKRASWNGQELILERQRSRPTPSLKTSPA